LDSTTKTKLTIRWLLVAALFAAAWVLQARFSAAVSAAMALPYDAANKSHDSLMAASEAAAATIVVFAGIILALFNIQIHRQARKSK